MECAATIVDSVEVTSGLSEMEIGDACSGHDGRRSMRPGDGYDGLAVWGVSFGLPHAFILQQDQSVYVRAGYVRTVQLSRLVFCHGQGNSYSALQQMSAVKRRDAGGDVPEIITRVAWWPET